MTRIVFETADGRTIIASATDGESAMRAAVDARVPGIDGDCGGACSCATCHVTVPSAWRALVGAASALERDMLAFEGGVTEASRLACQIKVHPALDGVTLQVVRRAS